MSDNEEQIAYVTIFHIIPPFFGAILGGLLGLLLSWLFGLNAFFCVAIGGYSLPLLLLVIFLRLGRDEPEPGVSQRISWQGLFFAVRLYLVFATIALLFFAISPLKSKLKELRERERQTQPQEPRE